MDCQTKAVAYTIGPDHRDVVPGLAAHRGASFVERVVRGRGAVVVEAKHYSSQPDVVGLRAVNNVLELATLVLVTNHDEELAVVVERERSGVEVASDTA